MSDIVAGRNEVTFERKCLVAILVGSSTIRAVAGDILSFIDQMSASLWSSDGVAGLLVGMKVMGSLEIFCAALISSDVIRPSRLRSKSARSRLCTRMNSSRETDTSPSSANALNYSAFQFALIDKTVAVVVEGP